MEQISFPPTVYQFRVVLQGISPLIWRRILVRRDMSLATLHATLQIVFAWSDMHLHAFVFMARSMAARGQVVPALMTIHATYHSRRCPCTAESVLPMWT